MSLILFIGLFLLSLGIVAFGIVMLKIAYDLPNPVEFIVVFFAASLVILIGMVLAVGFGIRGWSRIKKNEKMKISP